LFPARRDRAPGWRGLPAAHAAGRRDRLDPRGRGRSATSAGPAGDPTNLVAKTPPSLQPATIT
jgi:hypothetical protein